MFLIIVIAAAAAVGVAAPKAVKAVGHATACVVSFNHFKSCKTPAPVAAPGQEAK